MTWKEIASALAALISAIIAGVSVWYFTHVPSPRVQINFSTQHVASFDAENRKVQIYTLTVSNNGDKTATDLIASVSVPERAKVIERKVLPLSGEATTLTMASTEQGFKVSTPRLVPKDKITISLLMDGVSRELPKLSVVSSEAMGTEDKAGSLAPNEISKEKSIRNEMLAVALIFLVLVFLAWILFFLLRFSLGFDASRNNAGFMFLHAGQVAKSEQLLGAAITEDGATVLELSNHALAVGLSGEMKAARVQMEAAKWWAGKPGRWKNHNISVVLFNSATLYFAEKKWSEGIEELRKAIELNEATIKSYCSLSLHIRNAADAEGMVRDFLKSREITFLSIDPQYLREGGTQPKRSSSKR